MSTWLGDAKEVFEKGGPVMWPLLALSVLALTLVFERVAYWLMNHGPGRTRWLSAVAERLRAGDDPAVRAMAAADRSIYGRIVAELLALPAHDGLAVELVERFRRPIERYLVWLSTIITAAPLLGILGTVTGIIKSFDLLGKTRHIAEIELVASGIAEALLTTAFGLVIALATLFPYVWLRGRVDRALGEIELIAAARLSGRK